ncbi:MAG: class I SAM-dependent methyltransferase [Candidatus Tectomicrobia bacterium]|uniref:Class I SAM-dependent methyltransferase n=1 Tax=Tectimicrobiota bacterium TaxID=2528274 RepID=A0A932HYQ6_UNCTE|nr:class I SAM-dependent methyltransferase [Candidatus Tectomicrobia bacterium]
MIRTRSKEFDAEAISHHYDLSNEFYKTFLCENMVYTCAYYRTPDGDLAQAQRDKMDLVCRKLRLSPGEDYLDIGCGWGSLAIWAAKHYSVNASAFTLSRAQAEYGQEWARREGIEDRCRIYHMDYRDFPVERTFSKISAIGIIEHVGIPNYSMFFSSVRSRLRDGGLFLNHGITCNKFWKPTSQTDFLLKYVFPNGELDNITHMMDVMEREAWEILDVENLRLHYARTCRHWLERLEANERRIVGMVGEKKYRIYRVWLACSSSAFYAGSLGLYQVLLQKHQISRRFDPPSTRGDIYRFSEDSF